MTDNKRLVIVGGVAAGMSAAAKVRRSNSSIDVTVFEKGRYVSYGACGLPWFICGRIPRREDLSKVPQDLNTLVCGQMPDENKLIARTPESFNKMGIHLHIRHEVSSIDLDRQLVHVRNLRRWRGIRSALRRTADRDRGQPRFVHLFQGSIRRASSSYGRWMTVSRCGTMWKHNTRIRR